MIKYYTASKASIITQNVIEILESHFKGQYQVVLPDDITFSQADILVSLFRDEVIIIDCTIPEKLESPSVYPILVAQINMLDHILLVSETDLPLNIKPLREPFIINKDIVSVLEKNNLSKWLINNIEDIYSDIKNTDSLERISVQSVQELLAHKEDMEMIQDHSNQRAKKRIKANDKKNILISYRSRYYYQDYGGIVKPLKDRICPVNYEEDYSLTIFKPESLCSGDEILTPMRRWMLVGLLDDRIRLMDEVWIYHTPDYFDSWWTISELVSVCYYNSTTGNNKPVIVRLYNPETDMLTKVDLEKDYNIDINKVINKKRIYVDRMARLMANTRPDIMAPEAREDILRIKSLASLLQNSRFLGWWILRRIRKSMVSMSKLSMPSNMSKEEKEEVMQKIVGMYSDPRQIIDYANDEVFSEDFWHKLSYGIGESGLFLKDDVNSLSGYVNLQSYFDAPMNDLINYSENELLDLISKTPIVHLEGINGKSIDGKITSVTRKYLWHITKMGIPGGINESGLEPINVFHMSPMN